MRRVLSLMAVVGLLFAVAVPTASAAPPVKWTFENTYTVAADAFCGYAVAVHEYGNVNVVNVVDEWGSTQEWHGTRDYTNEANHQTASMQWSWTLVSRLESQTATVTTVLLTNHGVNRIVASNGAVIHTDAGRIEYRRTYLLVDGQWVTSPPWDEPVDWNGPHTMDFGNNFCEVITPLLNP